MFYGKTFLDPLEQLWLLLAVPKDPNQSRTANPSGPFAVANRTHLPSRLGSWNGKVDIGEGGCDVGTTYFVLQVVSTRRHGRPSIIEELQRTSDFR